MVQMLFSIAHPWPLKGNQRATLPTCGGPFRDERVRVGLDKRMFSRLLTPFGKTSCELVKSFLNSSKTTWLMEKKMFYDATPNSFQKARWLRNNASQHEE